MASIGLKFTASELLLYLGWLFHLVWQVCGKWGDGQLGVGGDLEPASKALDDPVHVRVVVQRDVLPFPETNHCHKEQVLFRMI